MKQKTTNLTDSTDSTKVIIYEDEPDHFTNISNFFNHPYETLPKKYSELSTQIDNHNDVKYLLDLIKGNYKNGLQLIIFDLYIKDKDLSRTDTIKHIRNIGNHKSYCEDVAFVEFCSLVPIIAYSQKARSSDAIENGANEFITKNFRDLEGDRDLVIKKSEEHIRRFQESMRILNAIIPRLSVPLKDGFIKFLKDNRSRKTAFIMTSFMNQHKEMAIKICEILNRQGIVGIFADKNCKAYKQYSEILLQNLEIHMLGCDFGIGIYKDEELSLLKETEGADKGLINKPRINSNMSFEVGFMMASGKKVIPIKDCKLSSLTTDLQGNLYLEYDETKPNEFESGLIGRLEDLEIIDKQKEKNA